jgi:DUF1009 family protein
MQKKYLGLIAGSGKFPICFAQKAKAQGYCVVAAAIKGDASFFLRFFVDKIAWFEPGDMKNLISYLQNQDVKEIIMAGQVSPNRLFEESLYWDEEFKGLFEAMQNRKADTIFAAIGDKLKEHGMELADSTFLIKENLAPKGTLTKRGPTEVELDDIAFGKSIAKQMGDIDVGQTVVIKEKAIVAIEAMEGTDKAILRGGAIAQKGAVVVKMSKPNQDLRFDVPVIGPRTLRNMGRIKASCLAIEAGKTIIIDRDTCIKLANKSGITIVSC